MIAEKRPDRGDGREFDAMRNRPCGQLVRAARNIWAAPVRVKTPLRLPNICKITNFSMLFKSRAPDSLAVAKEIAGAAAPTRSEAVHRRFSRAPLYYEPFVATVECVGQPRLPESRSCCIIGDGSSGSRSRRPSSLRAPRESRRRKPCSSSERCRRRSPRRRPTPRVGVAWVPGHWVWRGNEWFWARGHYVEGVVPAMPAAMMEAPPPRPSPAHFWVRGHWGWESGRWNWRPGLWFHP